MSTPGAEREREALAQEGRDRVPRPHQLSRVVGEQHQVVDIADVVAAPEPPLHELLELVQIDVRPEPDSRASPEAAHRAGVNGSGSSSTGVPTGFEPVKKRWNQ